MGACNDRPVGHRDVGVPTDGYGGPDLGGRKGLHRASRRLIVLALAAIMCWGGVTGVMHATGGEQQSKSLRILAIGNSFSADGLEHVYWLARTVGYDEVVLANLYIGSSGLEHHWSNAQTNAAAYRYDKNVNGTWVRTPNQTLQFGIQDENWDLITMHQRGGTSGDADSFHEDDRLNNLIAYIKQHRTNENGRIGWQMTWAYEVGSTRPALAVNYNGDQMAMYEAIVNAAATAIDPHPDIDVVIPVGTALQNVRTSYIGDALTRDGYHLSYNLGRYIGGLTWLLAVTESPIDDIVYVPSATEIPGYYLPLIKEAVKAAINTPYAITPSTYTVHPQLPPLGSAFEAYDASDK